MFPAQGNWACNWLLFRHAMRTGHGSNFSDQ
jgi:hypothetical protein